MNVSIISTHSSSVVSGAKCYSSISAFSIISSHDVARLLKHVRARLG
jgi:hypothetical protein